MRSHRLSAVVIIVQIVVAAYAASARAEIRIEGSASKVRLEARDASVADILAALGKRFALRSRGTTGATP